MCGDFDRDNVGEDAGEQCADGKSTVPPQSIHADGACTPRRIGNVTDCGEERWVHHCGSNAENYRCDDPPGKDVRESDARQRDGLQQHSSSDERLASDAVRERTSDQLKHTPRSWIDRSEHSNARHRESCGCEQ